MSKTSPIQYLTYLVDRDREQFEKELIDYTPLQDITIGDMKTISRLFERGVRKVANDYEQFLEEHYVKAKES